jgi:hypothetical protein
MGFLSWFYVEAKAFERLVEEGLSILHFSERSKGYPVQCTWVR